MPNKKKRYCVLDSETATMPFANELASGDPEKKKKIAIAKPLIYDIGWTLTDRQGNIYDRKQFLIAETFAVPQIFNTAYYADKRPIYLEMLQRGETQIKPWNEVIDILLRDLETVDAVGAYNSMFDFKKAIPFTDLYIHKLYSPDYQQWEEQQKQFCNYILNNPPRNQRNPDFEEDVFRFRGKAYPLFDLWGLAAKVLLNNASYKKECLNHDLLSASGLYFKTSAETAFQYLCNKYDFVESHTALDDAEIETFILSKIAARHSIEIGISFFPFRELGETIDFCMRLKTPNKGECETVKAALELHLETKDESTAYYKKVEKKLNTLKIYMGV